MDLLALPARRPVMGPTEVPHRIVMGMAALGPGEAWLQLDRDLMRDLAEKRRLLRAHPAQVWVEEPASRPAQREARNLIAHTLLEMHPTLYRAHDRDGADERSSGPDEPDQRGEPDGAGLRLRFLDDDTPQPDPALPPLCEASLWLQEDLCLMERRDAGWCLTAGSVCFPTRWDLPSRLSLPMPAIHERVPGYAGALSNAADRFFDGIAPGRIFVRGNWSLMDDEALFQPGGKYRSEPAAGLDADNAGDRVWLRVERQATRRLPASGAILFTIRIHRTPLREIARQPEDARRLLASLRSMSPEMQRYKSLSVVRAPVEAYLSAQLEGRGR